MTFGQQDRVDVTTDWQRMLHWALSGAHAIFWLPPNLLCSILRVVRTLAGLLSLL